MAKKVATKKEEDSPSKSRFIESLEKPLNFLIAVITLIGIGVTIGAYFNSGFKDSEMQIKLLQAQNDCADKVQVEREKCNDYRNSIFQKDMDDLKTTVKEIKYK